MSKSISWLGAALCIGGALLAARAEPARAQWGEPSAAGRKIAEALKQPTVMEFIDTPLVDVIEMLKDYHRIEIQLDLRALDDVGIPNDTPITKNIRGVSLRSGLRLMLRDLDLTYTIADEVLLITTPEEEERLRYVRVYPVADLIGRPGVSGSEKEDCESLMQVIAQCVVSKSWRSVGGPGTISTIPPAKPKSLVVSQYQSVHDQIAEFLEHVRRVIHRLESMRQAGSRQATSDIHPVGADLFRGPAERRIAEALQEPTILECIDTPLQDVIETLKDYHRIESQIDQRALDDVGIASDTPISKDIRGVSLAAGLRLMLRELDLAYVIRDEVLLITTPEEAEMVLLTRIYPVPGPGAGQRGGSEARRSYYDSLIKTITTVIHRDTWDDAGGPGKIVPLSTGKLEALVVCQTADVHQEVAGLLAREEFRQPDRSAPRRAPRRRSNWPWRR